MPLVLPRVKRPVGGDPVDRDQGPVDHHERVPGFRRVLTAGPSSRSPCGEERHGPVPRIARLLAVPTSNPAARSANVSPLGRWTRTGRACCPGVWSRQQRPDRDPVAGGWIPAT